MPKGISSATGSKEKSPLIIAVSDLRPKGRNPFEIKLDVTALQELATQIGVETLRKLRFAGEITAAGKSDWLLTATLGVTIVQPCVVTLAPVTTRIDHPVTRQFTKPVQNTVDDPDVEFDGQDDLEPLESDIDLGAIMAEALTLVVPEYPRADGAELAATAFSAPGTAPLTDADVKPFAGLAALKEKMQK